MKKSVTKVQRSKTQSKTERRYKLIDKIAICL